MLKDSGAMLCTTSGTLLLLGVNPGIACQLSDDDGITSQCCHIDTTHWTNGITYEIKPNVALYARTVKYRNPRVRIHLIRITSDGPEPVDR